MELLPKDVLDIIFAYMPTEILGLCSSVCKLWNTTCWRSHSVFQIIGNNITPASFELIVKKSPNLKSWEFHRCSFVNNALIEKFVSSTLTSLHLVNCPNVSTPICKIITDTCKNLQELNIKDSKRILNHKKLDEIILPPTLLVLNIEGSVHTNFDVIQKITQMCKSLRVLRLKGCYRLEDLSVRAALRLPDLEILGIEGLKKVSSNSFNVLEESNIQSNLKEIDMRMCDDIDNKVIEIIATHCPKISCLIMKFCKKLSDPCATYFTQIPIEHLDLQGTLIGDEGIKTISESCTALTTLDLRDCDNISSAGYCSISSASNLSFLRLRANNVDDLAVTTIAGACKNLKLLDLEACINISDIAASFLKSCKHISRVSLKSTKIQTIYQL